MDRVTANPGRGPGSLTPAEIGAVIWGWWMEMEDMSDADELRELAARASRFWGGQYRPKSVQSLIGEVVAHVAARLRRLESILSGY